MYEKTQKCAKISGAGVSRSHSIYFPFFLAFASCFAFNFDENSSMKMCNSASSHCEWHQPFSVWLNGDASQAKPREREREERSDWNCFALRRCAQIIYRKSLRVRTRILRAVVGTDADAENKNLITISHEGVRIMQLIYVLTDYTSRDVECVWTVQSKDDWTICSMCINNAN